MRTMGLGRRAERRLTSPLAPPERGIARRYAVAYKSKLRIDDTGRQCSKCGAYKPWSEFGKNKHGTKGRQSWCKDCFREYRGSEKGKEYVINDKGRECSGRGQFKPWADFHRRSDLSTGHASACKACVKARTRRDMENGPIRNRELQHKYGISLQTYQEMVEKQGDACAICGTTEKGKARGKMRYWSVDHDHLTGEVRALLCQKCNALLGLAGDDPLVLERAITYLREHGK